MELGLEPEDLTVHLTTGADFKSTVVLAGGWPTGASLKLEFEGGTIWTATISGTDAVFDEDKAVADLIASGTAVALKYVLDTSEQTWATGSVVRHA